MNTHPALLLSLLLTASTHAAESDVLREAMGETVYRQSGIRQLSEEQLRVLEAWIVDHARTELRVEPSGAATEPPEAPVEPGDAPASEPLATAPAPTRAPAPPVPDADPDVIRSRIDGPFEGWRNNDTLFRLQNGQIWQQRHASTFITDLDSPEVIIRKHRFGYTMEVPAIDRKVHVTRVR